MNNLNNLNNPNNEQNIIIKFSQKDGKFVIYDKDKLMGIFSVLQIIKYITSKITQNFLLNINYESSVEIIEKYFCKYHNEENEENKENKETCRLILIGYLESPIMGNIEIIMKIYSEINKLDKDILQKEIIKLDEPEKTKIIKAIKNLEYMILNHSLKLIVNISEAIKNDKSKDELKSTLTKYSIFIINKINFIICDNMNDIKTEIIILNAELEQMKNTKINTDSKIKKMEHLIQEQNKEINKIVEYIEIDDIDEIMDSDLYINKEETEDKEETEKNKSLEEFNDSDYSYTEESNKKVNIDYLSENE
jgi:hypothetical protein